jgi:hypothetical protein
VKLRPDPLLPVPTLAAAEALAARLGQNPAATRSGEARHQQTGFGKEE